MGKAENVRELPADQLAQVSGGSGQLGIYRPGFRFKEASLRYFRQCVGDQAYNEALNSDVGRRHHYVAARVLLNQADWERFVWIEEFGSLDGFPERG